MVQKDASPEPGSLCEGCRNPNAWMLIDKIYTYVCGGCAEKGSADVLYANGVYRGFRTCKCGYKTMVATATNNKLICIRCNAELFLGGMPPQSS